MIDVTKLQTRLIAAGYDIGAADGVAGGRTMAALLAAVAGRPMAALRPLGSAAAIHLPAAGLMASVARLANFLGQAAHESGGFRALVEIWGPTLAQAGYQGRLDLGNTTPGDGFAYRGRGLFQITGRAVYRAMGTALDLPLEAQPDLAAQPDIAVRTACAFWAARKLSDLADAGQDDAITHRINGGSNGIDSRRRLVARAKGLLL
ncbi:MULTISPECIES: hypothetical protein [Novosphingobium]|uniref:hypothetical protein n=1 Tax=Novosphingobium TaxID=165696 RepID=UPI0007884EEF|nr:MULTISPECIES: hypothetical protein [Novosphingobium]PTR06983.1 putative chitinase [Novosphingobium sp. GV055]PUA99865.1 putative chitinase [Novosphingobium sp. GV061]PUB14725.1 putative chitinase [Novosphingobium sp. GV079]PUB38929.1 putative chitinase [Novosphingobium sp. GV027]WQD93673.1 glycoside hydrolase family 19 protein [Novosphingobium capsulatum]